MNRSFFIFLLSALSHFSNASSVLPLAADSIPVSKTEFKLGRIEFLEAYGKDDTGRALINFFFAKRSRALTLVFIGLPELIGSSLLFNDVLASTAGQGIGAGLIASAFLGAAVDLGLALIMIGIIKGLIFYRKKLLSLVRDYYAGKGIPVRIAKSRLFKEKVLFERKSHR